MPDPSPSESSGVNEALVKAYNSVAYTSYPDATSHPDRLATIGTLLGLDVAPVANCRVLELACGDGTNLVPIASSLPNATFVGFDFAAKPVARAQRMADDLGNSAALCDVALAGRHLERLATCPNSSSTRCYRSQTLHRPRFEWKVERLAANMERSDAETAQLSPCALFG